MKRAKNKNIKNRNSNKRDLSNQRKKRKNFWWSVIILLSIVLTITLLSIKPYIQNKYQKQSNSRIEIKFKKEGKLSFFDKQNKQIIRTIDIEIAEDEYERAMGLMYRYAMSDSVGMLFIMEKEEYQSFWMKNTYISLDILYLNTDFRIVKIQKYTQSFSEQAIPSIEKAKYVIEVIGGFCDVFMIEEGDSISYEKQAHTAKTPKQ
jgi:hypothetical protein